jgi:lycopene cyclase domain-containing protein
MDKYLYLIINIACISVPFLVSFYRPKPFYKEWKYYIPANILVLIFFVIWDIAFTNMGVWGFNERYLTGVYLFNLPIEEWLFFITIPYACVFTYFAINHLFPKNPLAIYHKIISISLICILLVTVLFVPYKAYTTITFLLLGVYLLYHIWMKTDLSDFYRMYLIILLPFFISNGILTGSFIEDQVVWYNDTENLGVRLFTIPIEDSMYGMLLLLLNVDFMEKLKAKLT